MRRESTSRVARERSELLIQLAPYASFAYPLIGLVLSRSEVPIVVGRYSPFLAAILLGCVAIYAIALAAHARRMHSVGALCLIALAVATVAVPSSNAGQRLPAIGLVLPAVRLLCGLALIVHAMRHLRRAAGVAVGLGATLVSFAALDAAITVVTRNRPPHAQALERGFRHVYDLSSLPDDAIVLVGDSFVWGQGVLAHEAFGARLEQRYAAGVRPRKVYSLGTIGGNVGRYVRTIALLPPNRQVDRIVLSYYVNDMPPAARWTESIRNQLIALGVGAPTLRLVADVIGERMTPTLADYNAMVIGDYDPAEPTFDSRWSTLEQQIAGFHAEAAVRSRGKPVFLIIPLMVDFRRYPLESAHSRLASLAHARGYEVIDLLPLFRERLGDGTRHLAADDENHFDAVTHELVAAALQARL